MASLVIPGHICGRNCSGNKSVLKSVEWLSGFKRLVVHICLTCAVEVGKHFVVFSIADKNSWDDYIQEVFRCLKHYPCLVSAPVL